MLDCCHSGYGIDSSNSFQPYGVAKADFDPLSPNKSRALVMPADIANRGIGLDLKPRRRSASNTEVGLLISGCQSSQTSADAWIHNKYMGAATFFLVDNLKRSNWDINYKTLVSKMNRDLKKYGYTQRPELNGSDQLFMNKFLK